MTAVSSFIKEPKNVAYFGEDRDEKIMYILRRSHWTNVGWVVGLIIMGIIPFVLIPYLLLLKVNGEPVLSAEFILTLNISWYIAIFGLFLFSFFNWYFNVYIITDKKIVDFDFYGLTYKNISDTLISNIQDVTATISGPFRMIFNIGDVIIQTAAEKREFDFMMIDNPGKVRDIISDLAAEEKYRHREGPAHHVHS